ncbi:Ectodysplasin-A [Orchesella cincta]|uniref:Ectodysplasin-A n=1 Tax=Orchesella cincta TaxID=48709 RepID=A0A1D2NAY2_ORCCI|nr:Ectodysplasin-A [Orchesella cincta]
MHLCPAYSEGNGSPNSMFEDDYVITNGVTFKVNQYCLFLDTHYAGSQWKDTLRRVLEEKFIKNRNDMNKSEITEILLPAGSKVYKTESITNTFLKAFLLCGLIFATSLAVYRYETKFQEMEFRLADLEVQINELQQNKNTPAVEEKDEHRNKRQAPEYPWVVRSADGDPVLNVQPKRGDDDGYSTEEGLISGRRRNRGGQGRRQSNRRRGGSRDDSISRNHDDETFYTVDAQGRRFYPSGLKEIRDRLPPLSSENVYVDTRHAPDLRTRSLPPLRRVGQGNDQVSARVVTFEEPKKPESVVAHFVADVSNFTAEDNPRLRNTDGIFQIWKPQEWMSKDAVTYDKTTGAVTIRKKGIYYIYAQIHYHDENVEGYVVEINEKPLLQCTSKQEFNSCFTAGLTLLNENDKVVIKNIGENIFSIFKPEKSFFGLMKVADA